VLSGSAPWPEELLDVVVLIGYPKIALSVTSGKPTVWGWIA
jgi:hypothetical protein